MILLRNVRNVIKVGSMGEACTRGNGLSFVGGFLFSSPKIKETEMDFDYWILSITSNSEPEEIEYEDVYGHKVMNPPFSLTFSDFPMIKSVCVYEKVELQTEEVIRYDKAIVLEADKNYVFCIAAMENIADVVQISWNREQIAEILEGCSIRFKAGTINDC